VQLTEIFNTDNRTSERVTLIRDFMKLSDQYKQEYLEALTDSELDILKQAAYILRDKTDHWLTNILSTQMDSDLKDNRKYMAAQTHALRDILWDVEDKI
jgi:hypothetical protein